MRKKLEATGITNLRQKDTTTITQPYASRHSMYGANNLTKKKMKYNIGDEVFWNDPDEGICSGYGKVTEVNGEIYSIKKDDGGELEALEHELT